MNKLLIALSAIVLLLSACQKEPSFEDPDAIQKTTSTSGQLIRAVEVDGVDSNIISYTYDTSGRLSLFQASATIATLLYCKIERSATGLITKTVTKSDEFRAIGVDSLVTNFYSNASNSQYTYSRYDYTTGNVTISDSTVFVYTAGKISSILTYEKDSPGAYAALVRTDYGYTGSNIASEKNYDYDTISSAWVLSTPTTYSYDAKVNPLKLDVEGLLTGFTTSVGDNNVVMEQSLNSTVLTTVTYNYTHNAAGKPVSGTRVISSGSNATTHELRFYYN